VDAFIIVIIEPSLQILLQLVNSIVDLSAKSYPLKLIQHRLMKPLTNTITLRTSRLGLAVIDVLHSQV